MNKLVLIVISVLVLFAGAGLAVFLAFTGPEPSEKATGTKGVLVETMRAMRKTHRVNLRGKGIVRPARQIQLLPRVSGKLVEVHPALEPGGVVDQGTVMAKIDPEDYIIAVDRAQAAVTNAESELRLEEGRRVAAQREWELLDNKQAFDETNRALALREPQLAAVQAQLESAQARLREARLNLERTRLTAPFPAVVLEESADLGQLVTPQTPLATLADSATFWVEVSLPAGDLKWISFAETDGKGSKVEIRHGSAENEVRWNGQALRRLPSVTPDGRMAQVLIEIPDPLNLAGSNKRKTTRALLIGNYVDVRMKDVRSGNWLRVPRRALRGNQEVWVFVDGKLEIRTVKIAWRLEDYVMVSEGLEDGEQIVLTNLPSPVPGLALRLAEEPDGK